MALGLILFLTFIPFIVDINSKLTFDKHISRILAKANRILRFVKRNIPDCIQSNKRPSIQSTCKTPNGIIYEAVIWDPI